LLHVTQNLSFRHPAQRGTNDEWPGRGVVAACTDDDRIGGGDSSGRAELCVSDVIIPSGALPQDAQPPTANVATAGLAAVLTGGFPNAGEFTCRGP